MVSRLSFCLLLRICSHLVFLLPTGTTPTIPAVIRPRASCACAILRTAKPFACFRARTSSTRSASTNGSRYANRTPSKQSLNWLAFFFFFHNLISGLLSRQTARARFAAETLPSTSLTPPIRKVLAAAPTTVNKQQPLNPSFVVSSGFILSIFPCYLNLVGGVACIDRRKRIIPNLTF